MQLKLHLRQSVQLLSHVRLCDLVDCCTPGFSVHHQLPELAQIQVHGFVPFSSGLRSFPASGSFPMSQFFASGGQRIRVSASASILPVNLRDWFPLELTGWISLLSKGLSRVLQHHSSKASILQCSAFFIAQLSHAYMITGKTIALTRWTFVGKVSVKLRAMPCRATQDRWVMVDSSDKTWSTGEGNANHFSILALRTPWTVWKGKKIGHWKMNSSGW